MKLYSLQSKIGGTLILVLLIVLGIGFTAISLQSRDLLKQQANESIEAVHEVVLGQARSIFSSLDVGTRGSLERGEMDVFDELLSGLGSVPGVIEVGLTNPQGVTTYSSNSNQIGKPQSQITITSITSPIETETESAESIFMTEGHMFESKCLDCHDDATNGHLAGVLYVEYSTAKLNEERQHSATILRTSTATSLTSNVIVALLCLTLTWLVLFFMMRKMIMTPLRGINQALTRIGHGHLQRRLGFKQRDMIGQTAQALDNLADSLQQEIVMPLQQLAQKDLTFTVNPHDQEDELRLAIKKLGEDLGTMIRDFQAAGEQIDIGSSQVSEAAQQLSDGATQSAASVEQISSSMSEMGSQTNASADNARQANQLAQTAQQAADTGAGRMADMIEAMAEIDLAGQNIGKIIKVIDEIAFQTNLLALNAAVEAARAGQHGKGFAVVAEEVRNLAARSAKAAAETSELIQGSIDKTSNGTRIAEGTALALEEIVTAIGKVTHLISDIATASSEQALGISQVNQGLQQIDEVIQRNTANAEESAATSEELSNQAAELRYQLSLFKMNNTGAPQTAPTTPAMVARPTQQTDWGRPASHSPAAVLAAPQNSSKSQLIWSDRFKTGVPLMDNQHKTLIDLINRLFDCMLDGGNREEITNIVDELVSYTVNHFRAEEDLMRKHHYPKLDEHIRIHQGFIAQISVFADKIKAEKRLSPADIYKFLKDWLVNHIEKEDRDGYGTFINQEK